MELGLIMVVAGESEPGDQKAGEWLCRTQPLCYSVTGGGSRPSALPRPMGDDGES